MKETTMNADKKTDLVPRDEPKSMLVPETSSYKSKDLDDKWMIRECDVYKDEYSECTSLRGRFQQYFVYGETLDCNQWKKDYNSCCKWRDDGDVGAAGALVSSERRRREARLRAHYGNTTWRHREAPPAAWARPLPEWMVARDENSYLASKARELRGEADATPDAPAGSLCALM